VAEPIAMSADIPHQAKNLMKRMKSDQNVDMKNHWKVCKFSSQLISAKIIMVLLFLAGDVVHWRQ
jgi:hypothetical protein